MSDNRQQRPILIIEHTEAAAPGAVVPILKDLAQDYSIVRVFKGEPIPESSADFAAIISLGGSTSAPDEHAWISLTSS